MENIRYNISPCSSNEVTEFIKRIDNSIFVPNGMVSATERSHYDRYSFLSGENKIAVVYDTSACILSITGRSDLAKSLLDAFGTSGKTVKSSTVPSQGTIPKTPTQIIKDSSMRAKLFVSPDSLRRRTEFSPVPTLFVSSKGAEISTDEIYPPQMTKRKSVVERNEFVTQAGEIVYSPQVAKKRVLPSYGESRLKPDGAATGDQSAQPTNKPPRTFVYSSNTGKDGAGVKQAENESVGISITAGNRTAGAAPRRTVISFGSEDDDGEDVFKVNAAQSQGAGEKKRRGRPPKNEQQKQTKEVATEKKRRGRPPKNKPEQTETADVVAPPEYKNGYSVKNFPPAALNNAIKRLKSYGKTVVTAEVEFAGTIQEVKNYTVSDAEGQKVLLRYATKRMTVQLQGKRSALFAEVMSEVSSHSDYSSALESYVSESGGGKKVSDVQNKLKKRLPTAFEFLSEQSRIDFSYCIHDFNQPALRLSDYSVLLVPAFRGLERFVFDLQSAEGIKVKMIGQAFDKDDSGKYILKSGYTQRIGSVIYAEVLVALYSEYFAQRNFFAHSDNTESNMSRSIPERAAAQKIFDHLLDVVEYNAKKLKEIGFSIKQNYINMQEDKR